MFLYLEMPFGTVRSIFCYLVDIATNTPDKHRHHHPRKEAPAQLPARLAMISSLPLHH